MWTEMKKNLRVSVNDVLDAVFPPGPLCPLCQQPARGWLCDACEKHFSKYHQKEFCRKCGKFVTAKIDDAEQDILECFDCAQGEKLAFAFGRGVSPYTGICKDSLYQLKYTGRQSVARTMGLLMSKVILSDRRYRQADVVVPVPIGPGKLQQRGFNQSELLAEQICSVLFLPLVKVLLKKTDTPAQAKQDKYHRQLQVKGMYQVRDPELIVGRRVLLVDDVLTTGSTASECARELLAAGAEAVMVITWATGAELNPVED